MSEPYLPLYIGDYLRDTGYLTLEQHGAYFMLLMRLWSAGGTLPSDEAKLARIAGVSVKKWRPIWADLAAFFEQENGQISHKRITTELEKAGALRAKRAAAGAKGGAAKSLKLQEAPVAIATAQPKQIIPDQEVRKEEPSGSSKKQRAARLSADWVLPAEWRQDALDAGLPADRIQIEAERMRDWSMSSPSGAKLNWRASWRNWARGAAEKLPKARGSPSQQQPNGTHNFYTLAEATSDEPERAFRSDQGNRHDAGGVPVLTISDYRRHG